MARIQWGKGEHTPSLRSWTRSLTATSRDSTFVFNLRLISLAPPLTSSQASYHFVNVFCCTVIHFCCSAKAIFVNACSCGGSIAFSPWSAGRLLVWKPLLLLPVNNSPDGSVEVLVLALRCKRFVNCLERLASRVEEVRSRLDFMLDGGDGGNRNGAVEVPPKRLST